MAVQQDNLFKAFGLFIEAFRPYIVEVLARQDGDKWSALFVNVLTAEQREKWNIGLRMGTPPENMIDYHHLKSFAIKYKESLRPDFDKKIHDLPNWLGEIADVRHGVAHFTPVDKDEVTKVWIHLRNIAKALKMPDLVEELQKLQDGNIASPAPIQPPPVKVNATNPTGLLPWFEVVNPHSDIKQGKLDESVFAADLTEVALGNGREVYKNPVIFFQKTYFTAGLKNIIKKVIRAFNGDEDAENRVISLQTNFGGGKTHTLISLYHICKMGRQANNSAYTQELLAYTGIPQFESAQIAVFTNKTSDVADGNTTADGIHIQTIWGQLAYQLAGKEGYEIIRKNDEQMIAPAGLFGKVLALTKHALILIDELADYCVKASGKKVGNSTLADQTISFMQELTEAVAATKHCVAIITLPASLQEVGNTVDSHNILTSLQKRVGRIGADTQPVADEEVYEVIRRRLFDDLGSPEMREAVVSRYMELYQEYAVELPNYATKSEYRKRLLQSYPFHPELIDIFRIRWASHHNFQRTRGVLRLLAAIISDLWQRRQSLMGSNLLIHSGQANLANVNALSSQIKHLYGNGYDGVITADIAGSSSHAFQIDAQKTEYGQWYLSQSISSVILMSSFGSDGANKGISIPEIKLHLLTPKGFNHNNINGALDELESVAYYLYYAQTSGTGKRYWFHTKPNINILINQAKGDIKEADIHAEILKRVREKTKSIQVFHALVEPPDDLAEQEKPTLLILSPKYVANPNTINGNIKPLIEKLATKKGNSERIYRNTILFLLCSEIGIAKLQSDVRDYLACQKISNEYGLQLEREQREDTKKKTEEASKSADISLAIAYSIVVKYSVKKGIDKIILKQFKDSLDTQINTYLIEELKKEEWLLDTVGLSTYRAHNLLPTPTQAIKVKDVYEAFIRFDDKPMIIGTAAVAKSLQTYCYNGEFCIAAGDGKNFTRYFFKENLPSFDINDATYWIVDKSLKPQPEPPSYPTATSFQSTASVVSESAAVAVSNSQSVQALKSITISGKVPLEHYTQVFQSFIMPLAQNNIEIEIRIKAKSTSTKPLTTSSQEYKIAKESAKQLGLNFEEE